LSDSSLTGENRTKKPGTFKKGDPRINRKGRPKAFDGLRDLALMIAHEEARVKEGGAPVVVNGHTVTVVEMILRSWATSRNPILSRAFIESAYGKVPDETILTQKYIKEEDAQVLIDALLNAVTTEVSDAETRERIRTKFISAIEGKG